MADKQAISNKVNKANPKSPKERALRFRKSIKDQMAAAESSKRSNSVIQTIIKSLGHDIAIPDRNVDNPSRSDYLNPETDLVPRLRFSVAYNGLVQGDNGCTSFDPYLRTHVVYYHEDELNLNKNEALFMCDIHSASFHWESVTRSHRCK